METDAEIMTAAGGKQNGDGKSSSPRPNWPKACISFSHWATAF